MINSFLSTVQKRHQMENIVISYFIYLEILAKIPNQPKTIVYLPDFHGLHFAIAKVGLIIPLTALNKSESVVNC